MKYFKFVALLTAVVLVSTVSWAGNRPEYDAVGVDQANIYSQAQQATYGVVNRFWDQQQFDLEALSDFVPETFSTNAGQIKLSPCTGFAGGTAHLTDVWNEGTYSWTIVLQMKPESDINLNIYDCVLKHNELDIFNYAEQTGRYRQPWGELMFNPLYSPLVSAVATPGPYATSGFKVATPIQGPLVLQARALPGLVPIPLIGVAYTSKAHWPEGIVIALPKSGMAGVGEQTEYNLKQGDRIRVTLEIPPDTNTVDVWYGVDSVILKYIGIVNTEYFAGGPGG